MPEQSRICPHVFDEGEPGDNETSAEGSNHVLELRDIPCGDLLPDRPAGLAPINIRKAELHGLREGPDVETNGSLALQNPLEVFDLLIGDLGRAATSGKLWACIGPQACWEMFLGLLIVTLVKGLAWLPIVVSHGNEIER
jgi:hypothetical protein